MDYVLQYYILCFHFFYKNLSKNLETWLGVSCMSKSIDANNLLINIILIFFLLNRFGFAVCMFG